MGFSADAYWSVGGFRALPTGEDVELVDRFEAAGLRIHRDAKLSVETSDRRDGRAPGGFARHLRNLSGSALRRDAGERMIAPKASASEDRSAARTGASGRRGMIAGQVGRWVAAGELDLPLPGSGQTALRWHRLAELTEADVVAGRLAEAHTDAVAILAELHGPTPNPISCGEFGPPNRATRYCGPR